VLHRRARRSCGDLIGSLSAPPAAELLRRILANRHGTHRITGERSGRKIRGGRMRADGGGGCVSMEVRRWCAALATDFECKDAHERYDGAGWHASGNGCCSVARSKSIQRRQPRCSRRRRHAINGELRAWLVSNRSQDGAVPQSARLPARQHHIQRAARGSIRAEDVSVR
jgi:hypothetical protein